MIYIVLGILAVGLISIIKSFKDPDVLAASELKMDVRRYKKYREWFDEHARLMRQYGTDSKQANEYFNSFFMQIKNPNEWRRYGEYRFQKESEEWRNLAEKMRNGEFDKN